MSLAEPLFFKPILAPRIWGGRRLGPPVEGVPIGEAWIFSPLLGNVTVVESGDFEGESVLSLTNRFGAAMLGPRIFDSYGATFPLLVKILDTAATLSVQLHPNEQTARSVGLPCGKREAWYVLPEGEGAHMLLGLRSAISRTELAAAVAEHRIGSLLNRMPARAGCCYEVPAGTIHALDAGNFVLELQQPSDTTYRLYDWDRVDARGMRRELHIKESLAAATLAPYSLERHESSKPARGEWAPIVGPPFFSASRVLLMGGDSVDITPQGEALLIVLTEGDATLCDVYGHCWELPLQRAVMLTAQFCTGRIRSRTGSVVVACRVH